MAPYLATVQIGRYVVEPQGAESGVDSELVAPPSLMSAVREATADQPRMIALFTDLFGPYPFEGYRVVVTDDPLEIPLESQTLSTFGRNHVSRAWEAQRLIAHELAHQWFGNAVTAGRLADIWLHEGFACYAEWLWSEAAGHESADDQARRHHELLRSQPQDLLLVDPGRERTFDDRVYKRGALALHALRRQLGDETFFALLRDWVAAHRYGTVSTPDFEAVVARVGGEPALDRLGAWLRAPELPPLCLDAVGAGGHGDDAGP
jgi:aminopeptidase N